VVVRLGEAFSFEAVEWALRHPLRTSNPIKVLDYLCSIQGIVSRRESALEELDVEDLLRREHANFTASTRSPHRSLKEAAAHWLAWQTAYERHRQDDRPSGVLPVESEPSPSSQKHLREGILAVQRDGS
jgi:hypothetical protein